MNLKKLRQVNPENPAIDALAAMEVARRLGVAALIVGHLAIATQEIDIEGVSFAQAAGEFSARVYIVSTKGEVRTFYSSSTKAHTNVSETPHRPSLLSKR